MRSSTDTALSIQTSRPHLEVRDDVSELMVSFGRLLIPELPLSGRTASSPCSITRSAPMSSPTRTAPGNP